MAVRSSYRGDIWSLGLFVCLIVSVGLGAAQGRKWGHHLVRRNLHRAALIHGRESEEGEGRIQLVFVLFNL